MLTVIVIIVCRYFGIHATMHRINNKQRHTLTMRYNEQAQYIRVWLQLFYVPPYAWCAHFFWGKVWCTRLSDFLPHFWHTFGTLCENIETTLLAHFWHTLIILGPPRFQGAWEIIILLTSPPPLPHRHLKTGNS